MLTIVNPIGENSQGVFQDPLGNAVSGGSLALGAVTGGVLGRTVGAWAAGKIGGLANSPALAGVARLAIHGSLAMASGAFLGQGNFQRNLSLGLQAGFMSTGVIGALDDFSNGQVSTTLDSFAEALPQPQGGYTASNFNANSPSLTSMRSGNQYFGMRTGATYGGSADESLMLSGYRDDAEFYSAGAYAS